MSSCCCHFLHLLSLFVLLSSFALLAGRCIGDVVECSPDQRSLLLQLKHGFSFPPNELVSWKPGSNCCTWEGVTCDSESGQIISLDLGYPSITGYISQSLFNLTSLQTLNLEFDASNGHPIPQSGFEKLKDLTHLSLTGGHFVGQLPIGISHLTRLMYLNLDVCYRAWAWSYHLKLQNLVGNLSNLRELHLRCANMSSDLDWSSALSKSVPQLQVLKVSDCHLPGLVPKDIFTLKNWTDLDLSYNRMLSGDLPDFPEKNGLQSLDLSGCAITGGIPSSIGNLSQLVYLYLYGNSLTGGIPNSIGNLSQLTKMESKGRYARVAVEIDTGRPLVPGTQLELLGLDILPFWQRFEYEHIHLFCSACGRVGHRRADCAFSVASSSVVPANGDFPMVSTEERRADDDRGAPVAWINTRWRRGQGQPVASNGSGGRGSRQPPAKAGPDRRVSGSRDPARDSHVPDAPTRLEPAVLQPRGSTVAHRDPSRASRGKQTRSLGSSRTLGSSARSRASDGLGPPRGKEPAVDVGPGYFGCLGLDPPSLVIGSHTIGSIVPDGLVVPDSKDKQVGTRSEAPVVVHSSSSPPLDSVPLPAMDVDLPILTVVQPVNELLQPSFPPLSDKSFAPSLVPGASPSVLDTQVGFSLDRKISRKERKSKKKFTKPYSPPSLVNVDTTIDSGADRSTSTTRATLAAASVIGRDPDSSGLGGELLTHCSRNLKGFVSPLGRVEASALAAFQSTLTDCLPRPSDLVLAFDSGDEDIAANDFSVSDSIEQSDLLIHALFDQGFSRGDIERRFGLRPDP